MGGCRVRARHGRLQGQSQLGGHYRGQNKTMDPSGPKDFTLAVQLPLVDWNAPAAGL